MAALCFCSYDCPGLSWRLWAKSEPLFNDVEFNVACHEKRTFYGFGLLLPETANVGRSRGNSTNFSYSAFPKSLTRPRFAQR